MVHPQHQEAKKASAITPVANMVDFAKYLARRELVTTGLTKFDDQPESFRAWQSSFLNATRDVDLTVAEELDLLVKWLGKESSEFEQYMSLTLKPHFGCLGQGSKSAMLPLK